MCVCTFTFFEYQYLRLPVAINFVLQIYLIIYAFCRQYKAMSKDTESSCNAVPLAASDDSCIQGISKKTWDRFSTLKERRERQSHRSSAKRIQDIKSSLASRIETEFSNPDELASLHSNNVDLSSLRPKEKQPKTVADSRPQKQSSSSKCQDRQQGHKTTESSWLEVKPYLGINSHLSDETGGSAAPKSGLELQISRAVALQEYDVAEQLSDKLATRDFGVKIAEAIDAKRFTTKREHDAAVTKAAKKKKLAWGFEPKHRWETKGNM